MCCSSEVPNGLLLKAFKRWILTSSALLPGWKRMQSRSRNKKYIFSLVEQYLEISPGHSIILQWYAAIGSHFMQRGSHMAAYFLVHSSVKKGQSFTTYFGNLCSAFPSKHIFSWFNHVLRQWSFLLVTDMWQNSSGTWLPSSCFFPVLAEADRAGQRQTERFNN